VSEQLPEQLTAPKISINRENGLFSINFGENRNLIEGIVKICSNQQIFSNLKSLNSNSKGIILKRVDEAKGNDDLGGFKSTNITYELEGENKNVVTAIKVYPNQNFILFEIKLPDGLSNTSNGKYAELITNFPSFLNESPNQNIFTYRHAIFCPPDRKLDATCAPVVFYDDDLNCFVVSALDEFLNTATSQGKDGRINCGFQGELTEIPKDSIQKFVILFSKGINKSLEELGDLLRKYHHSKKKDPYSSIATSHLSYWTDNGAYYYYQREKGMSYEDTMVTVKDYFDKHNIPIQSYNFDSWWYLKYLSPVKKFFSTIVKPLFRILGGGLFGNIIRWEVDPKHFSTDLATFHRERFNYPIIGHSRRWDTRSPYLEKFEFKTYKKDAVPIKKDFWDWCMKHAKDSGIDVYEQDWMKNQINDIPYLRENFTAQEEWLNNMAIAAKENNVDVFYCMSTPGQGLYSIKHPNIVMARSSGDYNHRWPLTFRFVHCTQTNILYNAIGINSHQDVFRSKYGLLSEHYPELKCLIENLTAGCVAPGDKKEDVDWNLLKQTCRDDGLIFKPDKPLTANDLMFKKHRRYYTCDTYTKRDDLIWRYILIVNVWPRGVKDTSYLAEELGFEEEEFILYNYFYGDLYKSTNKDRINAGMLNKYEYRYIIACPIAKSGMSLIGCPDKFVTCSKKQFPKVESTEGSLTFLVEDIKGANVKVLVYSEQKPSSVQLKEGSKLDENSWKYLSGTHKVLIDLKFDKNEIITVIIKK
jgi:hypothetical protein